MSIQDRINKVITKFSGTEREKQKQALLDYIQKYRDEHVDEGYNPIHGLDQLTNDDIDYIMSISNRGDGKTYGYLGCLAGIAYHFDLPLMALQRHWTLREGAVDEFIEVVTDRNVFPDFEKFYMIDKQREYTCIYYRDKLLCIFCELDNSSDLKRKSFFIKKARILIYDEFITLPSDYVPQEAWQFVRIYRSVHRGFKAGEIPFIGNIKVICLGNPENLASPMLHMLDITRYVQQQPLNTEKTYKNVYVEKFENENTIKSVNLRAIPAGDTISGGDFQFNLHNIPDQEQMTAMLKQMHDSLWIKLPEGFLEIQYGIPHLDNILIRYMNYSDHYDYCIEPYDYDGACEFLDTNCFDQAFYRHHINNEFYYNDEYSRGIVLNDNRLISLNIYALVGRHFEDNHDMTDQSHIMDIQRKNYQERDIYQESLEFSQQWMESVFYGKI